MDIKQLIEEAENLGWLVKKYTESIKFSTCSPENQEFSLEVDGFDVQDIIKQIGVRYKDFDCSQETYYWLDDNGHGMNGAPYDVIDIYKDMEWCRNELEYLYNTLNSKQLEK